MNHTWNVLIVIVLFLPILLMGTSDRVFDLKKRVNAASLFLASMAFLYLLTDGAFYFALFLVSVAVFLYFWVRQIMLRKQLHCQVVRSAQEIWKEALRLRYSSFVLMLPLPFFCFLFFGFLVYGSNGFFLSFGPAVVYGLLVVLAERYPVIE